MYIKWVKNTAIKVVKTMAQTALGVIGGSAMLSQVDWRLVASSVVLSAVTCILMNVSQIEEKE